jgi:pyruvate/2-oxoglutarate dehydrogenase complex dihydrolipoamide dehydrogenase (E3) component
MNITTQVHTTDPNYPYDDASAATQVLAALGGNPTDDTSTARVQKMATQIITNVTLDATDNMPYTAEQAADQVLAALGGNPTTDTCNITMVMPTVHGQAGVPPAV